MRLLGSGTHFAGSGTSEVRQRANPPRCPYALRPCCGLPQVRAGLQGKSCANGDPEVRTALYTAASAMLTRCQKWSALRAGD
jgi:hypothetical protein